MSLLVFYLTSQVFTYVYLGYISSRFTEQQVENEFSMLDMVGFSLLTIYSLPSYLVVEALLFLFGKKVK
jgi:hypothetical protein